MKPMNVMLSLTAMLIMLSASPAYGVDPLFVVTNTADTSDGTCDAHCTLREAITKANLETSSSIQFDSAGVFATPQLINLTAALPAITASVIISDPLNQVTIRRNSGGNYRIFSIPNAGLTVKMYGLTISNGNSNSDGGGIFSTSYLELHNSTVDGNQSGDHGGGVSLLAGGLIENSTISNNSASSGGGLYFEPAPMDVVLLINSTVSGNTSGLGTAILLANFTHANNVTLNVNSCTIAYSTGVSSAVMAYALGAGRQASINLTSTILSNNGGPNLGQTTGGGGTVQITSGGYNLASDAPAALTNTGDQVNLDPFLGPLADNGGPTPTHALPFGSLALDQGQNLLRSIDQRGLERKRDLPTIDAPPGGDESDVGAFEYNEVLIVENDQNSGAGSLRAAIQAANTDPDGNYIEFNSGFFSNPRVIRLESPLPDLLGNLTITGPGARLATVRRHSGGDYRIFTKPSPGELAISGLTISNGKAPTGGGIESRTFLQLKGVVVSGNQATYGGGGVSIINGSARIVDSTLHDNRAGQGGGLAFQGDVGGNLKLFVINSTISGNRASLGGGLILNHSGQNHGAYVYLESSTIAGNQGVGIHADISVGSNAFLQVQLHNTIVANPGFANLSSYEAPGNYVSYVSTGFNLFSDSPIDFATTATDQYNMDPLLAPLAPNGGPTPVHALRGGSPALDQGQHGYLSYPDLDQRSLPRNFDTPGISSAVGGDSSDIGAVEMQALNVTNANDSGAGSLRQAMLDANGNGAGHDDILFDSAFFATPRIINLASVLASITSTVNLVGPGADRVNLRRNTGGDYRIITNTTPDLYIGINDMTLSNGNLSVAGGGILSTGFLDLRRSAVSGNVATAGGGILLHGSGVIESSTISGNSASQAGGILLSPLQPSFVQLVNSTVSDNSAALISGIYVAASTVAGTVDLEVMNSTIANNTGGSPALNVNASGTGVIANVTLANSMLANNFGSSLGLFAGSGAEANIISLGGNLSTDNGLGFLSGPGDLIDTNPLLDPLANYGGPTATRRLPSGSPALDAGDCALSGVTRDQRGKYRPFDRPGSSNAADACDIGAFEWSDLDGDDAEDSDEVFQSGFEQGGP